jgi:hypothetical protein
MTTVSRQQRLQKLLSDSLPLLYVLLLVCLLIGSLWAQPGLPNSADGTLHLHRSAALARSWSAGVLWPRWFAAVYQGLGAPVFHYYSPLFYQLVAPLHLAGLPLDLSAKLVLSAFFLGSGSAVWAWLRRLLTPTAGLAGAALYLSQPYFFRELYFQGDYPQLLAVLFLPLVFWSFARLYQDGNWRNWLIAPLSLALLVVMHNITAMLGAGMLVLYWLALLLWYRNRSGVWKGALAAVFAAGLSAFFWLPALADAGLVRIGNLQRDFFYYGQYFVPWQDLLAAPPLFDSRAGNPPFPHLLGWAAWLAVAGGLIAVASSVVRRKGWTASRFWSLVGLVFVAVGLALTQSWSAPLWEGLPLLALVQFPGRLLAPAALGVALTGGAAVAAWGERRSWLLLAGLTLVVGLSSSVFLFSHQPFRTIDTYTAADTQAYERRSHAWGTTSGSEFLPRGANPPQSHAGQKAQERFLPGGTEWSWQTPHRAALRSAAGAMLPAGPLVLPVHYFPAWKATVDAAPVPIEPTADGLVGLELASPAHQAILHWEGTGWQKWGRWTSLLILLAWMIWIGLVARRSVGEASSSPVAFPQLNRRHLAPLALLILLILGHAAIRALDLGWFQRSSPPGAASHVAHPLHVQLGGGEQPMVTLLGWELLSSSPKPGSQVRLRLYWQGPPRMREDLHSFLHLYVPAAQRSWVGVQNQNPGRIPTSDWIPALYYVDDLVLQLPADLPPSTYTLAVGMVNDEGQRLAVPDNPDDLVLLEEVSVSPLVAGGWQPLHPEVATPSRFGQDVQLQGYDLLPDPGGPILRLYWQVLQPPRTDLVTFVHLLDEQGQRVAQFDAPPMEGLLPTSQWPARALLIDQHKIWLPEDLESGQYRFLVGLYDRRTGDRLGIVPEVSTEGHFEENALIVPLYVPP